ncbi:MAG: redoxin domain-containing protein [Cyclobacteriaceae bacterium]
MRRVILLLTVVFFGYQNMVLAQASLDISEVQLTNALDLEEVALTDYAEAKGVILIFTSNYCPYSKLYESRITELYRIYKEKGIEMILINPNDPSTSKGDRLEEMKQKALDNQYDFPYLADTAQVAQKLFKASKTPEAFLITISDSNAQIIYQGAIDDNPQVASDVNESYLKTAIDFLLSNQMPVIERKRATGCMIKKGS